MSMLTITGKVLHVFEKPAVKRGDDVLDAKPQVQILGQNPLPNGDSKFDLVTLTTDAPKDFEQFQGKDIRVAVGVFAPGKNQTIFFVPKGSKPEAA